MIFIDKIIEYIDACSITHHRHSHSTASHRITFIAYIERGAAGTDGTVGPRNTAFLRMRHHTTRPPLRLASRDREKSLLIVCRLMLSVVLDGLFVEGLLKDGLLFFQEGLFQVGLL